MKLCDAEHLAAVMIREFLAAKNSLAFAHGILLIP
jgi:hypothetical protein